MPRARSPTIHVYVSKKGQHATFALKQTREKATYKQTHSYIPLQPLFNIYFFSSMCNVDPVGHFHFIESSKCDEMLQYLMLLIHDILYPYMYFSS